MAAMASSGLTVEENLDELDVGSNFTLPFKEHDITLPGTSEIYSANAFRDACESNHLDLLSQSAIASEEAIFTEMGVSVEKGVKIRELSNFNNNFIMTCLYYQSNSIISEWIDPSWPRNNQTATQKVQVSPKEVLLSVDIFHPLKQCKDQNFLVLASQELKELRDVIICPNDYLCLEESSTDPAALVTDDGIVQQPLNISKSAFFFIYNTFYNDRRDPESIDTSRKIILWVEEEDRVGTSPHLDHFNSADMDGVTFGQLNLRLGYPYLYSHHGNCEHLVIFRDMRLFNPKCDPLNLEDYPRLVFCTRTKRQSCYSCKLYATWLTCDDELATESPCFFCQDCFVKLHYTIDGKKACRFRAYRYKVPETPTLPI